MDKNEAQRIAQTNESLFVPVGSRWLHYKGGTYEVIAVSCMEDKPETILVTYRSELHKTCWTRTFDNFIERWQENGGRVQSRFERIK